MSQQLYVKHDNTKSRDGILLQALSLRQFTKLAQDNSNDISFELHNRVINDKYTGGVYDGLARMLNLIRPCAGVYPIYSGDENSHDKKLFKLLIGYNSTILKNEVAKEGEYREKAILSIWQKIVEVSREQSGTLKTVGKKTFDLLSDIMSFPAYKVATNYGNLCERIFLEQYRVGSRQVFDDKTENLPAIINLLLIFANYGSSQKTQITFFNHIHHSKLVFLDKWGIDKHAVEKLLASFVKPESIPGLEIGNGLSQYFFKLHLVLKEIIIPHILGSQETHQAWQKTFKAEILAQHNECGYFFARAMQDVIKVPRQLYKLLPETEVEIEFIKNDDKLHVELAILQHRMNDERKKSSDDGFVPVSQLLNNPLGLSKLSCGWCWITFNHLQLGDYVKGCHGVFFDGWRKPSWNFRDDSNKYATGEVVHIASTSDSLQQYIIEYLHQRTYPTTLHDNHFLYANRYNDAFSDDENDARPAKVLRAENSDATMFLKKLHEKLFRVTQVVTDVASTPLENVLAHSVEGVAESEAVESQVQRCIDGIARTNTKNFIDGVFDKLQDKLDSRENLEVEIGISLNRGVIVGYIVKLMAGGEEIYYHTLQEVQILGSVASIENENADV